MSDTKKNDLIDFSGHGAGTKQFTKLRDQAMMAFDLVEENEKLKHENRDLRNALEVSNTSNRKMVDAKKELVYMLQTLLDTEGLICTTNNRAVLRSLIERHKEE